jgi:NAD+ diphosphatase
VLPVWRGKPLLAGSETCSAGWIPSGHPVLAQGGPAVFLGLDGGIARFAQDISLWSPEAGAEAVEGGVFDASEHRHPALPQDHVFAELRGAMTRLTPRDAELVATAKALLQWHASHGFCATCGAASDVAMAGWQRTCPSCGAHHFPRTDPVVIMLVTRGNSVLVGRSPGWPQGMYSLLAGFVEPGETLEAAVRLEVFEETGVGVGAVRYLASQPWPFPSSLMMAAFAEADGFEVRLDEDELEEVRWVTKDEVRAALTGNGDFLAPPPLAIAHTLLQSWVDE